MALTTLASVKTWLSIDNTNTANDSLLNDLIDSCSSYIETWLNRTILQANYSEDYCGYGTNVISVANYPIVSVSSVTVNGVAQKILPFSDYNSTGIKFIDRRIIAQNFFFPRGISNISINYAAGFAAVPADIKQACNELVALRYKNGRGERLGVSSKSLAGETVSFFSGEMADSTKQLLLQWRNVLPV